MWARAKEATKRGNQKWRVGDLLADERCSPAVLDFLRSTHVGRTVPPVEENWDSEEEAEVEEMGDGESKRSDPRALGIGFSSVCYFLSLQNVYFPWCGLLLFSHVLSHWYSHSALNLSAEGLPSSPTFGPGRQTETG